MFLPTTTYLVYNCSNYYYEFAIYLNFVNSKCIVSKYYYDSKVIKKN